MTCPTAKRLAAEERQQREVRERFTQFRRLVEVASAGEVKSWLLALGAMSPGVAREVGKLLLHGEKRR